MPGCHDHTETFSKIHSTALMYKLAHPHVQLEALWKSRVPLLKLSTTSLATCENKSVEAWRESINGSVAILQSGSGFAPCEIIILSLQEFQPAVYLAP